MEQWMTRRHLNVVACPLANKLARIVWVMLVKGVNRPQFPRHLTALK